MFYVLQPLRISQVHNYSVALHMQHVLLHLLLQLVVLELLVLESVVVRTMVLWLLLESVVWLWLSPMVRLISVSIAYMHGYKYFTFY
jgi:hypothetical protein